MHEEREQQIRGRAYALWQQDGEPEGREKEHWEQACRDMEEESIGTPDISPGPGAEKQARSELAKGPAKLPPG